MGLYVSSWLVAGSNGLCRVHEEGTKAGCAALGICDGFATGKSGYWAAMQVLQVLTPSPLFRQGIVP